MNITVLSYVIISRLVKTSNLRETYLPTYKACHRKGSKSCCIRKASKLVKACYVIIKQFYFSDATTFVCYVSNSCCVIMLATLRLFIGHNNICGHKNDRSYETLKYKMYSISPIIISIIFLLKMYIQSLRYI
jgi:hypothetical protein